MENDSLESEREKKYIDSGKKCSKITSNWAVLEKKPHTFSPQSQHNFCIVID